MASPTQDQWPGPPQVMPPLIPNPRWLAYKAASYNDATVEELAACYADVGQRLAKALHSSPPLAQDEVSE